MTQLISTNLPGNLHLAVEQINEMGLAGHVVCLDYSGSATVAVFKMHDADAPRLRRLLGTLPEHVANKRVMEGWRWKDV